MMPIRWDIAGWSRRPLAFALLVLAGLLPWSARAELLFAVSEGTSGGGAAVTDAQMAAKYKPLTDVMERVLQDAVRVRYVRSFQTLEEGIRSGTYDLVLARPSDYPARGVRDHGYSAVTTTRPDGHCLIVVRKDAPFKTVADIKGQRFIFPEESAYMTKFCLAELRDQGIQPDRVYYVREQAVIPFSLGNGLAVVGGVASYSGVAKRLDAEGLRVLQQSRPQPYLPLIASPKIKPAQVQALRTALIQLVETDEGAQALGALGLKGFDADPQPRLLALLRWLEAKSAAH